MRFLPDGLPGLLGAMAGGIQSVKLGAIEPYGMFGLQWSIDGYTVVVASFLLLAGSTADRVGRKPVFIFGALGSAVLIWPTLWAISRGDLMLIFVFGLLTSGIVYSAANAIWPSLYGEMFDTRVRLSGTAIGTQIGFALGGFAPSISAAVMGPGPNGWPPVAVLVSVSCIIAAAWSQSR